MKYKSNLRTFVDENLTESPSPCRRFPWLGPLVVGYSSSFIPNQPTCHSPHILISSNLSTTICQLSFVICQRIFKCKLLGKWWQRNGFVMCCQIKGKAVCLEGISSWLASKSGSLMRGPRVNLLLPVCP